MLRISGKKIQGQAATLIYLGCLNSAAQLSIAVDALHSIRTLWHTDTRLLVADLTGHHQVVVGHDANCEIHTTESLGAIVSCCQAGLLFPASNETFEHAALHALASGVPPTAINFSPKRPMRVAATPSQGDTFLMFGPKWADRGTSRWFSGKWHLNNAREAPYPRSPIPGGVFQLHVC